MGNNQDVTAAACDYDSVTKCPRLHKVIQALSFNQEMKKDIEKDGVILKNYLTEHCASLFEDYVHLIETHLNNSKQKKTRDLEFDLLVERVSKVLVCDFQKGCACYLRNGRDRNGDELKEKELKEVNDKEVLFWIDLLDSIHMFCCHSYDIGSRFKVNVQENNENDVKKDVVDSKNVDDNEVDTKIVNLEFIKMKEQINSIGDNLRRIGGFERIQHNKFNTDVVEQVVAEIKTTGVGHHDDDNGDEMKDDAVNDEIEQTQPKYSFGIRCYYWDYYNKNTQEDVHYHKGQSYGDWYIPSRFKDLKEEILKTPFQDSKGNQKNIQMKVYNSIIAKATKSMELINIKNLKCDNTIDDEYTDVCDCVLEYEIPKGSPIGLSQLVCLLCYTDFTDFCYWFGKSFRKLNAKETDMEYKKRKENWVWLSKGLREIVELFGQRMHSWFGNKIKNFYTGISCEVFFTSFCCRLFGPTSTTPQLAVATTFAQQTGTIVTLNYNGEQGDWLRYFNCSFLSAFTTEDERLLIGGRQIINFADIIFVKNGKQFKAFVQAITRFEELLSNSLYKDNHSTRKDCKVVSRLLSHSLGQKKNRFPVYINNVFETVIRQQRHVRIDMKRFRKSKYGAGNEFSSMLLSEKVEPSNEEDPHLMKIDYLTQILMNLESVCLQWDIYIKEYRISSSYLSALFSELSAVSTKVKLSEIKIIKIKKGYNEKEWDEFVAQLKTINFVAKECMLKEDLGGKEIPCLIMEKLF